MNRYQQPALISLCFVAIGILFLAVSGFIGWQNLRFQERASITEGLVIRMVANEDKTSPVVRFRLSNGEAVTFQSTLSSKPPRYKVEEKVMVRYDPEEPENAVIVGWMEEWFLVTMFGGFGVLFSVLGTAFLLLRLR